MAIAHGILVNMTILIPSKTPTRPCIVKWIGQGVQNIISTKFNKFEGTILTRYGHEYIC